MFCLYVAHDTVIKAINKSNGLSTVGFLNDLKIGRPKLRIY